MLIGECALLTLKMVLYFLSPFQRSVKDLSAQKKTVSVVSGLAKNGNTPSNYLPIWLMLM